MRRITWASLAAFVFAIPWEYSLVLPAPFGNVARILGLLTLAAALVAVVQSGRFRTPSHLHWLVLTLYLWWCCTGFWSIEVAASESKMRGYFQEMMILWLLWEFAGSAADLRVVLRAWVAGCLVLALLTLASFASADAIAANQARYFAAGQDPNDVARFLNLGLPLAALLFCSEKRWATRWMAFAFLPIGVAAVMLTASRGGFVAAIVALAGCALVLSIGQPGRLLITVPALASLLGGLWFVIPRDTLSRLATIPAELELGDLNQRINIWRAGWDAFTHSPLCGTGAGTFAAASHTAPIDTAHNTLLSVAVTGGLCAVFLAMAILGLAIRSLVRIRGLLAAALITCLAVWAIASVTATVEESRSTWLLLGTIAVAGRLATERKQELASCFAPKGESASESFDAGLFSASQ
jgi:putative inorganic carbon (HCO3(-)) transporter